MSCLCCIVDHKQPYICVQYLAMSTEPCQDSQCPKTTFFHRYETVLICCKNLWDGPSKLFAIDMIIFPIYLKVMIDVHFDVMVILSESNTVIRSMTTGHHTGQE